jgi:hypothetical protein
MLTGKRIGSLVVAAVLGLLTAAPGARALTTSDRGAAVVVFPRVDVDVVNGVDTVLQLSSLNESDPMTLKCFYVNANSHCTNHGGICQNATNCTIGASTGACVPGWTITDFFIILTREQPIGWRASRGLRASELIPSRRVCVDPVTGPTSFTCRTSLDCPTGQSCVANQSNAGTLVPGTPETPFMGELKCVQVDPTTDTPPSGDGNTNEIIGNATVQTIQSDGTIDVSTSNAEGLVASGTSDGNEILDIDTNGGEYFSCATVLVLDHMFDGAVNPIDPVDTSTTEIALVPCSEDLTGANPGLASSVAQFLVFNEFEQRFSAVKRVDCFFKSQLSRIDTTQPARSIWSASVAGTVAGQTRIRPIGSGLLGVSRLRFSGRTQSGTADSNIHQDGDRGPDQIILP